MYSRSNGWSRHVRRWAVIATLGWLGGVVGCTKDPAIVEGPPGGGPDTPPPTTTPVELEYPQDGLLPPPTIPADNPLTKEGIALGRMLFYDPILSGDSTQSCASCHMQAFAFTDSARFSRGITGAVGTRNAMQIINAAWQHDFFWDGRASSLEEQALAPVENPVEMAAQWPDVIARLQRHPTYPELFYKAFGTRTITRELVVKAIAQFERTLLSFNSKYDRYKRGEVQLTPLEKLGEQLFFSEPLINEVGVKLVAGGDCFHCHGGLLFTDNLFHNNGLDSAATIDDFPDPGLGGITGRPEDYGKFKTPTLRNIELTAPYMHDGRFATLEEVIREHYNKGGYWSPTVDPLMKFAGKGGLRLSDMEIQALVAFLKTLTDTSFLHNPAFSNPF